MNLMVGICISIIGRSKVSHWNCAHISLEQLYLTICVNNYNVFFSGPIPFLPKPLHVVVEVDIVIHLTWAG